MSDLCILEYAWEIRPISGTLMKRLTMHSTCLFYKKASKAIVGLYSVTTCSRTNDCEFCWFYSGTVFAI